jgi:hypothetical protein
MDSSGTSRQAPASPHPEGGKETPSVSPLFPLLLLETMRDRDRPEEVLEDEDISLSMPRRLGLSEVVRMQIRRFEEEVRHRRPQISSQVEDLCRLVIRRPDAEEIFTDAGRRVAERYWHEKGGALRRVARFLPRAMALRTAQRAARRMFRDLVGPTRFSVTRRPVQLRIDQALTVRADPGGAACAFYAGAFVGLLELYTGRRYRVLHPHCGTRRPEGACEWEVEIAS